MTTFENDPSQLSTPRIGLSIHESPEKGTIPLELEDIDAPMPVPFEGADQPGPHSGASVSAPELRDSQLLDQSSPSTEVSKSSPLTSSDKLSALPSSSNLGGRRIGSPNFKRANESGAQTFPSFGTPDNSPRGSLRLFPNERAYHASEPRPPLHRHSMDSDRGPFAAGPLHTVRNAISRLSHTSDPTAGVTPVVRSSVADDATSANRRRSGSLSRNASPLRIFQGWGLSGHGHRAAGGHSWREELFIPENPFRAKTEFRAWIPCLPSSRQHDIEEGKPDSTSQAADCDEILFPLTAREAVSEFLANTKVFVSDTTRIVYLHMLLRLPALYFGRVSRIFIEAEVSRPDIQRMIDACQDTPTAEEYFHSEAPYNVQPSGVNSTASNNDSIRPAGPRPGPTVPMSTGNTPLLGGGVPTIPFSEDFSPPLVTPALVRFKRSWEMFIDSLTKEWKTMNLVSALLLSAQITMFQVPEAANDPVTRSVALLSLMCALMSLSYGCIYIVRFSSMRSMVRASRWAEETRRYNTAIFWNLWILLCLPALWLAWSMILFIICLLSFTWRTGSVDDPAPEDRVPLSERAALGPRIAVTLVLALGLFYFVLIIRTLRIYGRSAVQVQRPQQVIPPPPPNVGVSASNRGRRRERGTSTRTTEARPAEPISEKQMLGLGLDLGRQESRRSEVVAGSSEMR